MCRISFLTTDNWLKSLKNSILIGVNQFLPENATSFANYSPESPGQLNRLVKIDCCGNSGKIVYVNNVSYLSEVMVLAETVILQCAIKNFYSSTEESLLFSSFLCQLYQVSNDKFRILSFA